MIDNRLHQLNAEFDRLEFDRLEFDTLIIEDLEYNAFLREEDERVAREERMGS